MGHAEDVEQRGQVLDPFLSVSDPAFAEYFGLTTSVAGVCVTEATALSSTAFYRGVMLLAGTIAGLPLKTYRDADGERLVVGSFLDNPAGPDSFTPFEWTEIVVIHLQVHGDVFLLHRYNEGGALIGLTPIHPLCVSVQWDAEMPGGKRYTVSYADGTQVAYSMLDLTHIMGPTVDGLRGISPITAARRAIGTAVAGDDAAAKLFANGALLSGLVTPDEDMPEDEAQAIAATFREKAAGLTNAGGIGFVNRSLKFTPWTMSAVDAQFLESRSFQVAEVARFLGIPRVLLNEDGASTWGSGISELLRGLTRFTLDPILSRVEARLSTLLPRPRFVEFERKGLLQGTPAEEIDLIIKQLDAGLLTIDEARALLNRPALATPVADPAADPAGAPSGVAA